MSRRRMLQLHQLPWPLFTSDTKLMQSIATGCYDLRPAMTARGLDGQTTNDFASFVEAVARFQMACSSRVELDGELYQIISRAEAGEGESDEGDYESDGEGSEMSLEEHTQ